MTSLAFLLSRRLRQQYAEAQARLARGTAGDTDGAPRQLEALRAVWADACADVPYYRDLVARKLAPAALQTWRDVQEIPELTRQLLQDHPDGFIRRSRPPDEYAMTGGSTGTPLQIGTTQSEHDLMRVVKIAAWIEHGYTPASRVFMIWGHAHLLGTGAVGRINHLKRMAADRLLGYRRVNAHRLSADICARYAEALIAFKPMAIISYAAALDSFARHTQRFRDRFRALGLRFVLATAEPAPRPDTIPLVEDLFGCPVVEEYGGTEFGQVAFKRQRSPFETYDDLVYLECVGADEESALPALVTALYPRYVPLLRYRVGDALAGAERWPNGHVHRFERVAGRENDVIVLAGGVAIHSLAFQHCVRSEPDVHSVQVVFTDEGIDLCLVAAGGDHRAMEQRIRRRLADVHPALSGARLRYVEDLETSRAGKRRWVIDQRTTQPCAASPVS